MRRIRWLVSGCAFVLVAAAGAQDPVGYSVMPHYQRAGTAYFGDAQAMRVYDEDSPIEHAVTACTVSDGEYRYGEGLQEVDIFPLCRNSRYMFAIGYDRIPPDCVADLDQDNDTDLSDLGILLGDYGCTGGQCPGDVDGDGDTDLGDLAGVLASYRTCEGDPDYAAIADLDGSGCVDLADLSLLISDYGCGRCPGDLTGDGETDLADLGALLADYGCCSTPDKHIYRSADGRDWESLGPNAANNLIGLADDTLVRTTPIGSYLFVLCSTDDGLTWRFSRWADTGAPFSFLTPNAQLRDWGWHQARNGTLIMVEYKLPTGGRYIYRSNDSGVSWRMVHDVGHDVIKHLHAVTKHEGLDRWVTVTGDVPEHRKVIVSDDDGLTWYDYTDPFELDIRPTFLIDYGHPTRLFYGADANRSPGWLDVSDGPDARKVVEVITNWDQRHTRNYCWYMFEHDGLYYACNWHQNEPDRQPVISVSRDCVNWAIYHRFDEGEYGIASYAGAMEGKTHSRVIANSRYKHFVISPADVATTTGLVLAPGATNLYDYATSTGASVEGWLNLSEEVPPDSGQRGSLDVTGAAAHVGEHCIYYSRTDGGAADLVGPAFPFEPRKTYQARFWVKGKAGDLGVVWQRDDLIGARHDFGVSEDEWREVLSRPITPDEATVDLRFRIRLSSTGHDICELYVDSLQVEEIPSTHWHPGGATRAPARASAQASPPAAWTNVFSFEPDSLSEYLAGAGELHVRSYVVGPDSRAELYFDPDEWHFVLRPTINGIAYPAVRTTYEYFQRGAQIRIGVRCDVDYLSLSIANGHAVRTFGRGHDNGLTTGRVDIQCYSDERRLLPHTLFNDVMYDAYLTTEQLRAAMNDISPVDPP